MGQEAKPNGPFEWPVDLSFWKDFFVQIEEDIHWMTPGRLADLVLAVRKAEAEMRWPDYEGVPSGWWPDHPATEVGRWAVLELYLRDFGLDRIDDIFGFPEGTAEAVVESTPLHRKARAIAAAHFRGDPPSRISRDVGVGIKTINSLLRKIGEEPHLMRDLAHSGRQNDAIVKLYEDMVRRGAGNIYREIARQLGLDEAKVKGRIQYLRRKGRITEDPPRDGRRRRGPAE